MFLLKLSQIFVVDFNEIGSALFVLCKTCQEEEKISSSALKDLFHYELLFLSEQSDMIKSLSFFSLFFFTVMARYLQKTSTDNNMQNPDEYKKIWNLCHVMVFFLPSPKMFVSLR